MQQMYILACLLGVVLQVTLLTQASPILTIMGAGPSTALFTEASAYLKVRGGYIRNSVHPNLVNGPTQGGFREAIYIPRYRYFVVGNSPGRYLHQLRCEASSSGPLRTTRHMFGVITARAREAGVDRL